MSFYPVDHVPAVARPGCANTISIYECIPAKNIRDAIHDVCIGFAAPVAADLIYKLLPVTGRTARVRREDYVTSIGKQLRIPAISPIIIPRALRSTVD